MWKRNFLFAIVSLIITIVIAIRFGISRWQAEINERRGQLEAARQPSTVATYDQREIEGLPEPVQRYFRTVLFDGQTMIQAASVKHTGTFNMSQTEEQWVPFTSTQRVITRKPGFSWDARIRMAPGVNIRVHDAYIEGNGILVAKLFGLLTVMEQPTTPELAQGEFMRFIAEAAWYPTALLPSQGVLWEPIDDRSASATLIDGATTVRLVIHFDDQGRISTVYSPGRYRELDGAQVAVPWQGRFWDYERRDGMLIPLSGEVAWLPPEQAPFPYWRGQITSITYE